MEKKCPTNGDIIKCLDGERSFPENLEFLKTKYPTSKWENCSVRVFRTKIFRLKKKIKDLKKNKIAEGLSELLSQEFEFPVPNIELPVFDDNIKTQKLNYLVNKTKDVVFENRQLKRELVDEQEQLSNLNLQIFHYEKKIDLLLRVLDSCTLKHQETLSKTKDLKVLERECKHWEKKYDDLSKKLDKSLEHFELLKEKVRKLDARNSNKKLKRRDQRIENQRIELDNKNEVLREKEKEMQELREESERKNAQVENLKKEKRNLLVKICRLNKKRENEFDNFISENVEQIMNLRQEIKIKEEKIIELEEINNVLLNESNITSFCDGKYTNEIRETIMTLTTECGVSCKKVNQVIQTVLKNITGKTLSRLPSAGVRSRLLIEAKRIAQCQVVDAMVNSCDIGDMKGNCLHQDGTSKFHKQFQSFQLTTPEHRSYSIGMTEVGSADADSLMKAFQANISELSNCLHNEDKSFSKLVATIISTMSDQGATNPVFNRQLEELRQSLLPDVLKNWDEMPEINRKEMGRVASFFCKMHVFVNMASEVDKCLSVFENNVCSGKNPYSFDWKESGASRLTRTVSKALTMHGCEKSGVGSHFSTHLKEKGVKNKLITFRGHRFNHLFYAAGATYHHLADIKTFLDSWSDPNELLKSISFDVNEKVYTSSLRALGIIDKIITGPFWRVIEKTENILDLNPVLLNMKLNLQDLSQDASPLLEGHLIFPEESVHKDEVYDSLFENTDDAVFETYTQMALELALGGMLLILERQAKDQLPGGIYYEPSETDQLRAAAVPTTNTCSERDFAQLDVLMRLKPSASTTAYESVIMWTNNKTSTWLNSLSNSEKNSIINDARKSAPEIMELIKKRQRSLYETKLEILRAKQEKRVMQENKMYNQKVKLTNKLTDVGGLWQKRDDIQSYKLKVSQESNKDQLLRDALVAQLQFRKNILSSKGPKNIFQQSSKGVVYSIEDLEHNLVKVMQINEHLEEVSENSKLSYHPLSQVEQKFNESKTNLAERLKENRRKITIKQQSLLLPSFIESPSKLVGKKILHKLKDQTSNEVCWYKGEVLCVKRLNGRMTKYECLYEGDMEACEFPLLIDFQKGEIIIQD